MANKGINLEKLQKDIITYHKKRKQAYKILTKDYPVSYQEIADKHINPRTGKPLSRQYIMIIKRKLLKQGKIQEINHNLGI